MKFRTWLESQGADIPLSNLYIPHHSINRVYSDRVNQYKAAPNFAPPTGVVEDDVHNASYFGGWVKLNRAPMDPRFPKIYITDGVHRLIALKELKVRSTAVKITETP